MTITGPRPSSDHGLGDLWASDLPEQSPIPLPEAPDGSRAHKRRRHRRARRRQAVVAMVLAFVLAAGAGAFVAGQSSDDDPSPGASTGAATTAAPVPPTLLVERASDGRASWISAIVPGPSGRGGNVLMIPPGTMAEIPAIGLEPIAAALALGGPDRLLFAGENLVGASLGTIDVVDADGLTQLLAATGALVVDIPARVEDVFPSGRVAVLYEPGRNRVEPAEVSRLLSAKGNSNDLDRLARHQAFWDAWLARIKAEPQLAPDGALGKALRALAAGRWRVRLLPVKSAGTLPGGQDIYQVEREALGPVVKAVFPAARVAAGARPRVQVLNGTGELGLAQRVSEKLIPAGVEVTLTGNANPLGHRETQVIYYDANKRAMAERVRAALGVGALVRNRNSTDVVDVTVIVGKDFPTQ